jgi:TolB protein
MILMVGCKSDEPISNPVTRTVPYEKQWGIYAMTLLNGNVRLIYSTDNEIGFLDVSHDGKRFVFMEQIGGDSTIYEEICTVDLGGGNFRKLTSNAYMDVYPVWSPNDEKIAFLSWRGTDLDIYVMDSSGANQTFLYNSGTHDGDIDWVDSMMVFTTGSRIWKMKDNGTDAVQLTDPPNAGVWGNADLPFGDYDPRISPDGASIVFERLVDDQSVHGNYNIYKIDSSGGNLTALTSTGYTQGNCSWSNDGNKIVFVVAAIGDQGLYDIYMMNADGSDNRSITPSYFPLEFLCNTPVFSPDDTEIYFIGHWY